MEYVIDIERYEVDDTFSPHVTDKTELKQSPFKCVLTSNVINDISGWGKPCYHHSINKLNFDSSELIVTCTIGNMVFEIEPNVTELITHRTEYVNNFVENIYEDNSKLQITISFKDKSNLTCQYTDDKILVYKYKMEKLFKECPVWCERWFKLAGEYLMLDCDYVTQYERVLPQLYSDEFKQLVEKEDTVSKFKAYSMFINIVTLDRISMLGINRKKYGLERTFIPERGESIWNAFMVAYEMHVYELSDEDIMKHLEVLFNMFKYIKNMEFDDRVMILNDPYKDYRHK